MLRKLRSKFIKATVLEELNVDGITYRVVDKTGPFYESRRALVFRKNNQTFIHSIIYINKKKKFQPSMLLHQMIIDLWGKEFGVKNALCLGAAGCAVPRFIAHSFKESHTVGIEYLPEFVDIAKRHFLIDEIENQFELLQGDAFQYVKDATLKNKFDTVFVDIFDGEKLPDEVFSKEFLDNLFELSSENAIAVFNLLTFSPSEAQKFVKAIKTPFNIKAVAVKDGRTALVLAKTETEQKGKDFLSLLETLEATLIC